MTIAVAYRPDDFGRAALDWAAAEARTHDESLLIINVHRVEPRLDTGHESRQHPKPVAQPFTEGAVEGGAGDWDEVVTR